MKTIILKTISNAKVNLALDILGVSKSGKFKGYHKIQTVFAEINSQNTPKFVPDEITIKATPSKKISITISASRHQQEISAQDSPIHKAALIMLKEAKAKFSVEIIVEKNIPISGGLGGGSGNVAAVINGLNMILKLGMSAERRRRIAAKISMDAPFFIEGGLALGENFGEKITNIPPVKGLAFAIFPAEGRLEKTKIEFSKMTRGIIEKCGRNVEKTIQLVHALKTNESLNIHELVHNDFELLLKKTLKKNIHLSGAGPSTFVVV